MPVLNNGLNILHIFGNARSPDGWSTAMGVLVWMGLLTLCCTAEIIQKD